MMHWISNSIAYLRKQLKQVQVKSVIAVVAIAVIVLTTGVSDLRSNDTLPRRLENDIHQGNSDRPKTTGEWKADARETEDSPLDRLGRIVNQTGEAVQDWGSLYPDVAERTIPPVGDNK